MNFINKIWGKLAGLVQSTDKGAELEANVKSLKLAFSGFLEAGMDHVSALCSLLLLEIDEAFDRLKTKIVCFVICVVFLLIAYLFGCAALVVYLTEFQGIGILAALLYVGGGNALIGLVALCIAICKKFGPIAPETFNEIKTDYECLRIAVKENKSSLND